MESRLSSDRLGPVETLRIDYRHRRTFTVETTEGDGFSYTWVYAEALENRPRRADHYVAQAVERER